jgi:hypothetical protein
MPFRVLRLVLTFFLDLVQALTRSAQEQTIELVLLRQRHCQDKSRGTESGCVKA